VLYANDSPVRIVNSTFSDNIIPDDSSAVIYTYFTSAAAWLDGTALVNNSVALPLLGTSGSGGFSSDVPREFYLELDDGFKDTTTRPADVNAFLNGDERWFQDVLAVRPHGHAPPGHALLPAPSLPSAITCIPASAGRRRQ